MGLEFMGYYFNKLREILSGSEVPNYKKSLKDSDKQINKYQGNGYMAFI